MQHTTDLNELNGALISNFRLKAKILSILFGVVLFFQLCAITFIATQTDIIGTQVPLKMAIIGPLMLAMAFVSELIAFRYMKRVEERTMVLKKSLVYFVTFIEVSFPCSVMFMVGSFLINSSLYPVIQILNSPLFIMIFIMIILSSLLLNPKLSLFAGVTGAIEYFLINLYFIPHMHNASFVDYANAGVKSVFVIISGLLCGFVSKKIREAVVSSLHSKNELIHNLDKRVAEKTAEVVKKNELLEEKQKEILDSIHYARRIQYTLLPAEKYISRILQKLKGQNS